MDESSRVNVIREVREVLREIRSVLLGQSCSISIPSNCPVYKQILTVILLLNTHFIKNSFNIIYCDDDGDDEDNNYQS